MICWICTHIMSLYVSYFLFQYAFTYLSTYLVLFVPLSMHKAITTETCLDLFFAEYLMSVSVLASLVSLYASKSPLVVPVVFYHLVSTWELLLLSSLVAFWAHVLSISTFFSSPMMLKLIHLLSSGVLHSFTNKF